jgi:zinc transporter, ZIP family
LNEFVLVPGVAMIAAVPIFLGAVAAELVDLPHQVVSAALQFAAGTLTAIVAFTLMPPALQTGPPVLVSLAMFAGGCIFLAMESLAAQRESRQPETKAPRPALGLFLGVLIDMVIDGVAIGVGSTLTLGTGVLLALGMAVSTAPLAFVTIATAKHQAVPPRQRRRLSIAFVLAVLAGAILGYWWLREQSLDVKLVLIALVSGFLITLVTQSMIRQATRRRFEPLRDLFRRRSVIIRVVGAGAEVIFQGRDPCPEPSSAQAFDRTRS